MVMKIVLDMDSKKLKKKIGKFMFKAVPIWLVIVLVINSSVGVGLIEYYIVNKKLNTALVELSKKTKDPNELALILKQQVLPQKGYTLSVRWNNMGKQLLESGAIDEVKYKELFANDKSALDHMRYLNNDSKDKMTINETNSRFMVNTLWAFGLVNKSKTLDEGSMKTYGEGNHMNFASTGGWNLGSKPTEEIYSSSEIVKLTPEQEELVKRIASLVYRPCCGNSTEFPDCNHGMAALGYIEMAVQQGVKEDQIFKDLLALNSFWFPQNYVELAAYLKQSGTEWSKVNPKLALSSQYSSSTGASSVRQSIQGLPELNIQGGGCGA